MILPFFQNKKITIYHADFQNVLEQIDEHCVVISDPPYNIGFNKYDEYSDLLPDDKYIQMLMKLRKFKRIILIDYPIETMKYIVPALGIAKHVGVWCYNSNVPNRFRLISYYGCQPNYSLIKQPYKNPNDKRIKKLVANGSDGTSIYEWWTDIQQVKNVSIEKTQHPCQIPEALIERIIKLVCKEGDVVFDPFAGSLTVPKVANTLGYDSISCELSENYIRSGINRIIEVSNV